MNTQWSEEDQVCVVAVPELLGCRTHRSMYVDAVAQMQDAIESLIETKHAWAVIPAPGTVMPVGDKESA